MSIVINGVTMETVIVNGVEMLQVYKGEHTPANLLHCKHSFDGEFERRANYISGGNIYYFLGWEHRRKCSRANCTQYGSWIRCTYDQNPYDCTADVNCNICNGNPTKLNTDHDFQQLGNCPGRTSYRKCIRCNTHATVGYAGNHERTNCGSYCGYCGIYLG